MLIGRRIAFDYGDVRIGVAICDRDAILASPLTTLQSKDPKVFEQISLLVTEYEPVALYVGDPLNLSGDSSSSAEKARLFADKLSLTFEIPVSMIDERLSTVAATNAMRDSGVNAKDARARVDMAAAVAILEQAIRLEKAKDV